MKQLPENWTGNTEANEDSVFLTQEERDETKATERRNTVKWAKHYIDSIDIDLEDKRYGQALIRIRELAKMIEDLNVDNFNGVR